MRWEVRINKSENCKNLVDSIREVINGLGEHKKNFILHDTIYVMALLVDVNLDPTGKLREEVWDAYIHNDGPAIKHTSGSVMRNHIYYPQQIRLAKESDESVCRDVGKDGCVWRNK